MPHEISSTLLCDRSYRPAGRRQGCPPPFPYNRIVLRYPSRRNCSTVQYHQARPRKSALPSSTAVMLRSPTSTTPESQTAGNATVPSTLWSGGK